MMTDPTSLMPGPGPLESNRARTHASAPNWRLLMGQAPTDELLGWVLLMVLAFGPLILWVLVSPAREWFE